MPYGTVPVTQASAAIKRIISLAYLLVWAWQEHEATSAQLHRPTTGRAIVLVDEVEAHLHPQWQRRIVPALLETMNALVGKNKGVSIQLIAATHSPLVLASVEPSFESDRDAWFDLDLVRSPKRTTVELTRRPWVPHGTVGNWLTSEAFDLRTDRGNLAADEAIQRARALLRRRELPTLEAAREVDDAIRRARLSDIDPFWVRWSAFMERLGGGE